MNAFLRTISYGGILALWIQSSQCLPSSHHSQEKKEPKRIENSVSLISSPRAMDVDSEELYEELGESESDSASSSIVISEVPNFQAVLNRLDRDENSSIFTTRKSDPLSPELNVQQDLEPIGNARITAINSEPKKLQSEGSSEIILFPKNHNSLRDFFQEHVESFFPDNSEDEEKKAYMTKIFSKTLENISLKERDDAVVFLIEKNISRKIIEKLFHVDRKMIAAFKVHPSLDPEESYENREKKAIELLKENISIYKIAYIVHININNIKNIANKEGIALKEENKNIDYSSIPQDLLLNMNIESPIEEKKRRAISLLKYNVFLTKIVRIVHMSDYDIKILAEKHGISIGRNPRSSQVPDEIKKYMVEISNNSSKEEKEKRALILLEHKVPIHKITRIVHMSSFFVKQLAEKNGITTRQTVKTFQAPDEIREYMVEMLHNAPREEKEKRALFLLKNKVPIKKISRIIHMAIYDIKKLAEKHNIAIRKKIQTFQVPDEIKEYMVEIPQNATKEEKEKRSLILLEHNVPKIQIQAITHMAAFYIKKLAEKHGISTRQQINNTFQVPDEIREYMVEIQQNSTREEKEKRALILLENKVPIVEIQKICHIGALNIKKLAEKHGIVIRKTAHPFQAPDEIREYMVKMPQDVTIEEKEKRALILLENKVPVRKIQEIVRMATSDITKLAEKHSIVLQKTAKAFQVPDKIKEYMVAMSKDTPIEEKEKRALILLENKVPIMKIQEILHMANFHIKKLAEKHNISIREGTQTFKIPNAIREYMTEMPQNTLKEEKEKRALFLLENKVPIKKISPIVHIGAFYIRRLAEKHGISFRKNTQTFQAPDEIREYMVEMSQDASREEREKRALILLENRVPIIEIRKICHFSSYTIKNLAEKYHIVTRKYKKS